MQKKLIALAIAGLSTTAFAQSNVTISGLMRVSYEQTNITANTAATNTGYNRAAVTDNSSMLVFAGKEELGNGMYASFQIDNRLGADLGGGPAATGNTNIKLGGTWGSVAMGRQDLHYGTAIESYKAYTLQQILSNGLFSQVSGNSIAGATRTNNVVWYDSPNMNGFSGRVAYSTNPTATEGNGARANGAADPSTGSAANVALNYANGPIVAGLSYWSSTPEGGRGATVATSAQKGTTLQFGYTFPMGLKVGLGWNKSTLSNNGGDSSRTAWVLPISYETGAHQVAFTYARAGDTSAGATAVASGANTGANAYTLSYGYSLSKRTNVGVAYTKLDNKSAATYDLFAAAASGSSVTAQGAGTDASQFSLNVNHAF